MRGSRCAQSSVYYKRILVKAREQKIAECPARKVKRDRLREYQCRADCTYCRGKQLVIPCPSCETAGILNSEVCQQCGGRGLVPTQEKHA